MAVRDFVFFAGGAIVMHTLLLVFEYDFIKAFTLFITLLAIYSHIRLRRINARKG